MLKVRVEVESLSTVTTRSSADEEIFREKLSGQLVSHEANIVNAIGQGFDQIAHRIAGIEDLNKLQFGPAESQPADVARRDVRARKDAIKGIFTQCV